MSKTKRINLVTYYPVASVEGLAGNCGMSELYALQEGPLDCIIAFHRFAGMPGLVVFSDAVKYRSGSRLADYIRTHRLGAVVASRTATNTHDPQHNRIQAWVWTPNYAAIQRWMTKHTYENYDGDNND